MAEKPWNKLNVAPPYELVEVSDKNGKISLAYPTFYQLHEKNNNGKPVWDGGWVLQCRMFLDSQMSEIVKWRKLDEEEE